MLSARNVRSHDSFLCSFFYDTQRAELKASTYGQDIGGQTELYKVEPRVISAIYRDFIIPLTKDVEVMYLFERVGVKPPVLPSQQYTLKLNRA